MNTDNVKSIEERIEAAIAEAHLATEKYGEGSQEIVEELHAEAGHQRTSHEGHNALTDYCDENPDAPEARMYDV